jgi:hypothetical protein
VITTPSISCNVQIRFNKGIEKAFSIQMPFAMDEGRDFPKVNQSNSVCFERVNSSTNFSESSIAGHFKKDLYQDITHS